MAVFVAGSGSARNKKNKRAGVRVRRWRSPSHHISLHWKVSRSMSCCVRKHPAVWRVCDEDDPDRRNAGASGRMKNAYQRKRAGKFTINRGDAGLQSAGRRGPEPSI